MKQRQSFKITIMLRLDIMPGRQELIGIFRYMKCKGMRWDVRLRAPSEISAKSFAGEHAPDGVIIAESQLLETAEALARSEIPVVALDVPPGTLSRRRTNIAFVQADNGTIGRSCMEYLAAMGRFASWGFVHDIHRRPWSLERERAFKDAVTSAGGRFIPMDDGGEDLGGWLEALPKPAAVMVACDRRAVQVLEASRARGIDIPGKLAVVSVDNDEMYCECMSPTVSSLDPNFENEGFTAAAELDRMLRSKTATPAKNVVIAAGKIVERESTKPIPTSAQLVQRALEFIAANAHKGIGVKDVVSELGVSRRLADLRFQQYHGKTILDAIVSQRMAKVKRQLSGTRLGMAKIAANCGFRSPKHLSVAFRKRFGISMSEYRNRPR